ncbi:hypothetical protein ACFVT5_00460 [Streptomyces sp. NPDC058001]|uniref:hypothetical protein n=1 Tax=Streptomyces sp. NPDC058001 TaxID=3346300 RepID=UPI0036F0AC91
MKRRTLPAAAALTATAALLLTACGGDETPKDQDKIAGAESSDAKKSPSPTATPDTAGRPDIALPKDVKDVFEGWKTGDATKDAVLADAGRAQTATNYAIIKGNPEEPAMAFYRQGDALVSGQEWVQSFVKDNISYTGTVRYYSPNLQMFDKKAAGLVFCIDESKAYNKDLKTGKVEKTTPSNDSYVLYNTRLEKNDQGIWQTTKLISERGNKKCTP